MTLILLFTFVVVAHALARLRWRKSSWVLYSVALSLFFGIGCGPVSAWLSQNLQADYVAEPTEASSPRTAIVLLGAGTEHVAATRSVEVGALAYGRIVKALELYLHCKQHGGTCIVLVSGGDARGDGASEAAVYGARLRDLGVRAEDLMLEGRSMNTWQNAQFCAALLKARKMDRTLLVTSGIHLRRGVLYFSHFGIAVTAVRADYAAPIVSPVPLGYNFLIADIAIHEYSGVLRYYVYQRLGWNSNASQSGSV